MSAMHDTRRTDSTGSTNGEPRPAGRRRRDQLVAVSARAQRALDQAAAAAGSELPVVVRGPHGSGRSFLARAIHRWSERSAGPLVLLAAGAVAEPLQARELFGSAAGAQRGLPDEHSGALARAAGGTLVLCDVDALRAEVRAALGRALVSGSFTREGDGAVQPLRARVLATAPPGADPFPGLPHAGVEVDSLAERAEDVLPLAAHFLAEAAEELGVPAVGFSAEARSALLAEPWPGNVRELRERVRQAVRLSRGGAISAEALVLGADGEEVLSFKEAKRAFETRYVEGLLQRCGGNISHAARLAKKDRKDFYDVIRRTGVDPASFRSS
jgi:two-component system response regulator GlrR